MRLSTTTRYVCLLAATQLASLGANPQERPTLTVRLYNEAKVSAHELREATEEAAWILGKANLGVVWVMCDPQEGNLPPGDPCGETPTTFAVGLIARAPDFLPYTALGFALVSSGDRNHAAVLYPRVAELAGRYPMTVRSHQVLAYAVVHEVGHLILGSTAHAPAGILRGRCRPSELQALNQRNLTFSAKESAVLLRKMALRAAQAGK